MAITVDQWQPNLVTDEILRRLNLIKVVNGYNTNPLVSERWEWPEEIQDASLPAIMVLEDKTEPLEGTIGDTQARGKLRWVTTYFIWGVVYSSYNVRVARHELLADVKSALYTGESLPTADSLERRAIFLSIDGVDYDGQALQDLQRGFFVAELGVRYDMTRRE